jgi:hypothetical protein
MVIVSAFGATIASADDGEDAVNSFEDGRLNSVDYDAPVFIYYTYETVQTEDEDGNLIYLDEVNGIQLWGVKYGETNSGYLAEFVSVEDINAAVEAANGEDTVIAEINDFTLNYSQYGYFWVTGQKVDGTSYSFLWKDDRGIVTQ